MNFDLIYLLETPGPSSDIFQAETESNSSRMKFLVCDLTTAAQQVEFIYNIPQHISADSESLQHSDIVSQYTTLCAHGDSTTVFSPS